MFVVLEGLDHKDNVSILGLNTRFRNRYTDFLKQSQLFKPIYPFIVDKTRIIRRYLVTDEDCR